MANFDLLSIAGLMIVSFCIVAAALIAARHLTHDNATPEMPGFDPHEFEPAVFLFDKRLLIDATDRARLLLGRSTENTSPWHQLVDHLSSAFTGVEHTLENLPRGEKFDRWSDTESGAPVRLMAEWRNSLLRVTVIETDESEASVLVDAQSIFAMERDAALLRAIGTHSPILVWKTRGDTGEVSWANRIYLEMAQKVTGRVDWPPPRLLSKQVVDVDQRRACLTISPDDGPLWFDVETFTVSNETLHFAVPADAAVKAEGALREFIQTLAKTFAHLPIGLAIFNRRRQLVLFNPALTDLSSLPVDFLSGRPTLSAFLDELRERQVMPEPKDYKSWRQKVTALEAAAVEGTFSETWSLPSGLTYRVTGRPHPEGAVAFLFEDISSEVTLTRRFRTDMELGQSVLDNVNEALAVFTSSGTMTLSNAAYTKLWGLDPSTTLGEISILDAMRNWMDNSEPSPVWGEARDFVGMLGERAPWSGQVKTKNGQQLACRFVPLSNGGTLMGFAALSEAEDTKDHAKQNLLT